MNDQENESPKKIKLSIHSHEGNSGVSKGSKTELDGTKNSGYVVLRGPNSSRPPEEAVFAIAHILEFIFGDLDRRTLLNCRLVSSLWESCASQQLRKTVTMRLENWRWDDPHHYYLLETHPKRTMEDLIDLLNNSTNFLATSFSFCEKYYFGTSMNVCPPIISFLNAHGATITKLCIRNDIIWGSNFWWLLSTQAPNLGYLAINSVYDQNCQSDMLKCEQVEGFDSDLKNATCNEAKLTFTSLKVFKCSFISDVTLALFLLCVPNLVEIFVPFENLHVLLKPRNRLYLVKELYISFPDYEESQALEQIADHHESDILLKKLHFEGIPYFPEDYPKAATFMSKILNASSATLEHLTWKGITGEFTAPQMPRVKYLTIGYSHRFNRNLKLTHVPISVSLGQTYPNLKSLFLSTVYRDDDRREIVFTDFFRDQIPVLSVTNVTISISNIHRRRFVELLREVFPKARFSYVTGYVGRID